MDNKYALGLLGHKNSGGWRFGGSSNDILGNIYTPEAYDKELMQRAGNPRGAIDKAMEVNPVSTAATTGLLGQQEDGQYGGGFGMGNSEGAANSGNVYGIGSGFNVDSAMSAGKTGLAGGPVMGALSALAGGLFGGYQSEAETARQVAEMDRMLQTLDASRHNSYGVGDGVYGAGTIGADAYGVDPNVSGPPQGGFDSPSYGDTSTADSPGGSDMGGYGGADNGYAKGGLVKGGLLSGPNPRGPDDGYAPLDDKEYVIRASSVKKYGRGLLDSINSGKFKG